MAGRQVYLTDSDLALLRESLDYSVRNVQDWWARQGEVVTVTPEVAQVGKAKVADLERLRDKLRQPQPR